MPEPAVQFPDQHCSSFLGIIVQNLTILDAANQLAGRLAFPFRPLKFYIAEGRSIVVIDSGGYRSLLLEGNYKIFLVGPILDISNFRHYGATLLIFA
jgi:hypothetical protein